MNLKELIQYKDLAIHEVYPDLNVKKIVYLYIIHKLQYAVYLISSM